MWRYQTHTASHQYPRYTHTIGCKNTDCKGNWVKLLKHRLVSEFLQTWPQSLMNCFTRTQRLHSRLQNFITVELWSPQSTGYAVCKQTLVPSWKSQGAHKPVGFILIGTRTSELNFLPVVVEWKTPTDQHRKWVGCNIKTVNDAEQSILYFLSLHSFRWRDEGGNGTHLSWCVWVVSPPRLSPPSVCCTAEEESTC